MMRLFLPVIVGFLCLMFMVGDFIAGHTLSALIALACVVINAANFAFQLHATRRLP